MPLEVGTRLGPYQITGSLGAGGMGEVYRATDTSLGREVAIKTLPAGLANDPDRLARFEREAQLLAALNHPHIASVYSLDAHDGIRYLAMELVDGETLEQKLRPGALPIDDALRLALQIAEALEAAHGKGVVHRDLKPANVMVTPEGRVKVLDFGLAKAFVGGPNEATPAHSPALSLAMTQQGLILGTAGYMSPEQASGQPADQRADVWAFGVVVYEMLTGLPVFSGESVPHILAGVLRLDPEWDRLPKHLHPAIRRMLERCLAKNVRNRYHAVADARIDIEEALGDPDGRHSGLSLAAGTAGALAARPLWRRALPWAAGLVLAGAAGVAAWTTKPIGPVPVIRATHVLPDGNTWRNAEQRTIIAISPDGSQIIYNSQQGLYLRALDSLEERLIPGTEGPMNNPVFSPDGQWIAYIRPAVGGGPELAKLPVVGGVAVGLAVLPTPPFDVAWNEQDRILLGFPIGVAAVSANGGPIEPLETAQRIGIDSVSMLPGGNTLLVGDMTGQVAVWPPGADMPTRLFPGRGPRYVSTGHLVYVEDGSLFAVPFDPVSLTVTGGPVPLVDGIMGPQPQFDVSVSGTLVWVPGSFGATVEARELAFVDRGGVTVRLDLPEEPYRSPRLSPDGTRVAVELVGADGMSNIWIYDLSGQAQIRQLTRGGNNTRPIWTPDGSRVTFASDRDGNGIWWQNADFSGVAERLTTSDIEQRPGSWDPAGQVLAFTTVLPGGGGGALGISTFSLASGETSVFYDPERNQESPAFSPDGKWIAYSSFERGNDSSQVYLQPYPPTGEVHPITTTGEAHPLWSPDGTELFFRRSTTAVAVPTISYVSIRTEPSVTWGRQQTLPIDNFFVQTQERSFDITPDGERLLIALPAGAAEASDEGEPRFNIVVNWLEEVRQRVPTD